MTGVEDVGSHYLTSTDPKQPACLPSSCSVLAVHQLTAGGEPLWDYFHRHDESRGVAVMIDSAGSVVVVGNVSRSVLDQRPRHAGVILKFTR